MLAFRSLRYDRQGGQAVIVPTGQDERTRISPRWSSGMSVSFSPWVLGITSYRLRGDVSRCLD